MVVAGVVGSAEGGGRVGVGVEELLELDSSGLWLGTIEEVVEMIMGVLELVGVDVEIMMVDIVFVGVINSTGVEVSVVEGSSWMLSVVSAVDGRYSIELIS